MRSGAGETELGRRAFGHGVLYPATVVSSKPEQSAVPALCAVCKKFGRVQDSEVRRSAFAGSAFRACAVRIRPQRRESEGAALRSRPTNEVG